jgi:hypothetical protein
MNPKDQDAKKDRKALLYVSAHCHGKSTGVFVGGKRGNVEGEGENAVDGKYCDVAIFRVRDRERCVVRRRKETRRENGSGASGGSNAEGGKFAAQISVQERLEEGEGRHSEEKL